MNESAGGEIEIEPYHDDVNERVAIVVTMQWHDRDSQQDWNKVNREVGELIAEIQSETFRLSEQYLGRRSAQPVRVADYQIGPAAHQFPSYLFTITSDINALIGTSSGLIALGYFARDLYRLIRQKIQLRARDDSIIWLDTMYSEALIIGLCLSHCKENYTNEKPISYNVYSRSDVPPIISSRHPGGGETYTVRIWTGRESIVYIVSGRGDVIEHFRIRGSRLIALPTPHWFQGDHFVEDGTEPMRTVYIV